MTIKYYYDLLSQPSRALYIFLKLAKIPHELCPVDLRNGEHFTEDYKNINRFQKVPCIVDDELDSFKLSESVAIFR
jgi:glutathione S-transferase